MSEIEIFTLRCLEAAARLGSLTAAARALGVSQPAVSVQIASLERHLGARLLDRRARGVRPTAAGESILERARRVLDEFRSLQGDIEQGALRGLLRIGSTDVVVLHRLPAVLKSFRAKHPGVDLQLIIEGSLVLAEAVRARDIELALLTLPIPNPPGPLRPLYRDPLLFVVAPRHALAQRRAVRLEEIAAAQLLAHKTGSVTRGMIDGFFTARGLAPRVVMEVSSPEVLRRMAQSGLGVAILPGVSVAEDLRRGRLRSLAVRGWNLERVSGLLLPPAGPPSRAGREFVRILLGAVSPA